MDIFDTGFLLFEHKNMYFMETPLEPGLDCVSQKHCEPN